MVVVVVVVDAVVGVTWSPLSTSGGPWITPLGPTTASGLPQMGPSREVSDTTICPFTASASSGAIRLSSRR